MLENFKTFGIEHIISIIIPIIIGVLFIILAREFPKKRKMISIILAITIITIRSVRYFFDINIGVFEIKDLLSLHICHIDLIILIICLLKPNNKLFTFNFLIGIPTALAVALMPGKVHPEPGMLRAIFFIMSHTMLVMGAIYLLIVYKFKITKKDLKYYYIFSLIGMFLVYILNVVTKSNYMYLNVAPEKTILESLSNLFGPFFYVVSIYIILVSLLTFLYYMYVLIDRNIVRKSKLT